VVAARFLRLVWSQARRHVPKTLENLYQRRSSIRDLIATFRKIRLAIPSQAASAAEPAHTIKSFKEDRRRRRSALEVPIAALPRSHASTNTGQADCSKRRLMFAFLSILPYHELVS
jgi:hypothetical protein